MKSLQNKRFERIKVVYMADINKNAIGEMIGRGGCLALIIAIIALVISIVL